MDGWINIFSTVFQSFRATDEDNETVHNGTPFTNEKLSASDGAQTRDRQIVRPPSHSDKDHKDRTTFLKRDKRRENGTKCRKNTVFKFVLRLYYAPARMSLRLTRSSYVLSRA